MIAAALLLLLLALLVPVLVALRVTGDLDAGLTFSLRCRVLGIFTWTRVLRAKAARGGGTPASPGAGPAPAAVADAPPAGTKPLETAHKRDSRRELWSRLALARRVLRSRAVRIARPAGWVEFAFADVAETGRLYGFACAIATLIDPDGALEIRPLWTAEEWLAADVALEARVHPLLLAFVLARAYLAAGSPRAAAAEAAELRTLAA